MKKVLILGGYGNFGKRIANALVKDNIPIIIVGRNEKKASEAIKDIKQTIPNAQIESLTCDVNKDFVNILKNTIPSVVINTCGPFQTSDYSIAEQCIHHQIHYIDLSDGRDFVNGISQFDQQAKDNNVLIVSGASTVPCLSSAVIDFFKPQFSSINSLVYGITPGQKATRGLATTQSILTYLGKPLKPFNPNQTAYGWQNIYRQTYPELGKRWMANCDIPDLDIFPKKYGIDYIQFSAGMENTFLHLGIWLTSWMVRIGISPDLSKHAETLLAFSHLFDRFGTADGGMHMLINGKDHKHQPKEIRWFIIAKNGDGPQIPCVPAILLTKKLINNELPLRGAMPCVGMLTLQEYLDELKDFSIRQVIC